MSAHVVGKLFFSCNGSTECIKSKYAISKYVAQIGKDI